ncbi:MAG TPA: hypothetical protein VJ140_17575, partial [Actinomycetota bacterium]|nr:hypothetical protein [Actinomycetota bacterium]
GRDLGPGRPGELLVRGPQVMAGYLGRPEATAAMVDQDGWLRTGDLGLVDGDGRRLAEAVPRTPSGKLLRQALAVEVS